MELQGQGMKMMEAWNSRCLPAAQELHRAYSERIVFSQFRAVAESSSGV